MKPRLYMELHIFYRNFMNFSKSRNIVKEQWKRILVHYIVRISLLVMVSYCKLQIMYFNCLATLYQGELNQVI